MCSMKSKCFLWYSIMRTNTDASFHEDFYVHLEHQNFNHYVTEYYQMPYDIMKENIHKNFRDTCRKIKDNLRKSSHHTREWLALINWTASSEFGSYRLYEQRRFRRACASAQSRQNLRSRSYKQWIKRNLQTETQIPGPSEWLGMRSWNLSWRNARRHKFAWRGSTGLNKLSPMSIDAMLICQG